MKTYYLILKSHTNYPDFEDKLDAETQTEALQKFRKKHKEMLADFDDDTLLDNIGVEMSNPF